MTCKWRADLVLLPIPRYIPISYIGQTWEDPLPPGKLDKDSSIRYGFHGFIHVPFDIYGLETVMSVLFSNTRTRLLYNEREIFNTARSEAECSIENFEFIVQ